MPISNPTALVEEFKRSGEFDRLRREVLAQFQQDESYPAFKESIENLARNRLTDDLILSNEPDFIIKELTQEIQRYPVVERAVANVRTFSDPAFLANMQKFMEKILNNDKNGKASTSSSGFKGTKVENTRTESLENPASQTQKIPPTTAQGNDAQGPLASTVASGSSGLPPTLATISEPLLSDKPSNNTAPEKVAQEENGAKPDGLNTPHDFQAPAANDTLSGPPLSSSVANAKANTSIDDHQTTIADVEMEDGTSAA